MRLILTRHGETEEMKQKISQGHLPGTLSAEGIRQAELLAERLREECIDAIYSSDLARSADTAKIIAKHHPQVPLQLIRELREADLGSNTGKKNIPPYWQQRAANAETPEQLFNRAKEFLEMLYQRYPRGNVICVGHAAINKALIAVLMGKTAGAIVDMPTQSNTAVNICEFREDGNHTIHLLNCTTHLD